MVAEKETLEEEAEEANGEDINYKQIDRNINEE